MPTSTGLREAPGCVDGTNRQVLVRPSRKRRERMNGGASYGGAPSGGALSGGLPLGGALKKKKEIINIKEKDRVWL